VRLVHFADDTQPLTELSTRVCVIEFFTPDELITENIYALSDLDIKMLENQRNL
jgi:hypothetical protein